MFEKGKLIDSRIEVLGRGHAERLVPMIAELPDHGRASLIRVSLGPGSFTGTRIGIAAARALGVAWQAKVVGYPTLSLVAAMAREERGNVPILVAMAGGHGELFVQSFGSGGKPDGPHASMKPGAASTHSDIAVVAGSKAADLVSLRGSGENLALLPDAAHTYLLDETVFTEALTPIYGRPPDARLPA